MKNSDQVFFSSAAVPTIVQLVSAPSMKVTLHRSRDFIFSINCHVSDGSRPVTFRWELNGASVEGSAESYWDTDSEVIGHLSIASLTPAHQGTYTCFTSNTVGNARAHLTVTVVGMLVKYLENLSCLLQYCDCTLCVLASCYHV